MNINLKKAYLKYYFGNYFVPVDNQKLEYYLDKFNTDGSLVFYLRASREELLKAGFSFLAHNKNYMNCFKMFGYDLIEFFLNHTEVQNSETFYDIPEENLIIYHPIGTTSNNRLVSLIKHVLVFRAIHGLKTLILSEEEILQELQDNQTSIVDLSGGVSEVEYDHTI